MTTKTKTKPLTTTTTMNCANFVAKNAKLNVNWNRKTKQNHINSIGFACASNYIFELCNKRPISISYIWFIYVKCKWISFVALTYEKKNENKNSANFQNTFINSSTNVHLILNKIVVTTAAAAVATTATIIKLKLNNIYKTIYADPSYLCDRSWKKQYNFYVWFVGSVVRCSEFQMQFGFMWTSISSLTSNWGNISLMA